MKLISILQGTTIIAVLPEDIYPTGGILIREMINIIASEYKFAHFPVLAPNAPIQFSFGQPIIFNMGEFKKEKETIGFSQLNIVHDAIGVTTQNTEDADEIMDNLLSLLHTRLGFKKCNPTKQHHSNVVVEFDGEVDGVLQKMQKVISHAYKDSTSPNAPVHLMRLSFGCDTLAVPPKPPLLAAISTEFLIERRGEVAMNKNRYYSTAPLSNAEHIRVLEKIEDLIIK